MKIENVFADDDVAARLCIVLVHHRLKHAFDDGELELHPRMLAVVGPPSEANCDDDGQPQHVADGESESAESPAYESIQACTLPANRVSPAKTMSSIQTIAVQISSARKASAGSCRASEAWAA